MLFANRQQKGTRQSCRYRYEGELKNWQCLSAEYLHTSTVGQLDNKCHSSNNTAATWQQSCQFGYVQLASVVAICKKNMIFRFLLVFINEGKN